MFFKRPSLPKLPALPRPDLQLLMRPLHLVPHKVRVRLLEPLLNQLLARPISEGEFDLLEARWLEIKIRDLDLSILLSFDGERLLLGQHEAADVRFSGNLKEFIILARRQEDPDTLFFQRRLSIEGDTELGLGIKNLLDSLDLEQLPERIQWLAQQSARLRAHLPQQLKPRWA